MKRTLLPHWLGALALPLGIAIGPASAAMPNHARPVAARSFISQFAVLPLATDGLRQSEQTFLESASEHTRRELRLAEIALSQTANTDLRALAMQLSNDQRQLRDSLEALMRKNGVGVPTGENQPPEEYQRLLEMSGATFDREVVSLLSKVHEELVTLFEQAASEAKDADVRALAAGQLPMVRDHRQQLIELKKVYQ